MALNSLGLGFVFTARDLASGHIRNLSTQFSGMDRAALAANVSYQRNFATMGAGLAIMGAGAGVLAGAFGLAEQAATFQQELARVGAISRASADELTLLHDAAIQAGIATQFSPNDAVQGLAALASQGLNARQSITALIPALDLAAGGSISVESATRAMSAALNIFGIDVANSGLVADQFLRISNATALEASDLTDAMANISRGAIAAGAGLEEMLPAIGLVRNTGAQASVAAHGVSAAIAHMAASANDFSAIGVSVTDAGGAFRPFLDIVNDVDVVLQRMPNAAERAAKANELFGHFGVGAYQSISAALSRGVRDDRGNLMRGAEAVRFLRDEMLNARGAAAEFRDQMLNTFAGQETLLTGSMQTLGIVVGEGFALAFRPIVEGLIWAANMAIGFFNDMPIELRTVFSQVVIVLGVMMTLMGAFVAGVAAFAIISPFFTVIVTAAESMLAALLPIVAVFGAIIAASMVLRELAVRNVGGFGDFVTTNMNRARLAFRALVQVFRDGGFSGAVRDELNQAENSGLRQFVVRVYQIGFRVVQFFRGIGIGFSAALETMGPTVEVFVAALTRLGEAFGFVQDGAGAVAAVGSGEFAETGASIGKFFGRFVELLISGSVHVINFVTDFVDGFKMALEFFGPMLVQFGPILEMLGDEFTQLLDVIGQGSRTESEKGAGAMRLFAQVLGGVLASALSMLIIILEGLVALVAVVVWVVRGLASAFMWLANHAELAAAMAGNAWANTVDQILNAFDLVVSGNAAMLQNIPAEFRNESVQTMITRGAEADDRMRMRLGAANKRQAAFNTRAADLVAPSVVAENEERAGREARNELAQTRIAELLARQAEERRAPIVLQVDGETIATAVESGNRSRAAAEGIPVPTSR